MGGPSATGPSPSLVRGFSALNGCLMRETGVFGAVGKYQRCRGQVPVAGNKRPHCGQQESKTAACAFSLKLTHERQGVFVSLPPLVAPADSLTVEEVKRYSRHLIIPDVGMAGQKRLKNAKVLCVGAGGAG